MRNNEFAEIDESHNATVADICERVKEDNLFSLDNNLLDSIQALVSCGYTADEITMVLDWCYTQGVPFYKIRSSFPFYLNKAKGLPVCEFCKERVVIGNFLTNEENAVCYDCISELINRKMDEREHICVWCKDKKENLSFGICRKCMLTMLSIDGCIRCGEDAELFADGEILCLCDKCIKELNETIQEHEKRDKLIAAFHATGMTYDELAEKFKTSRGDIAVTVNRQKDES